MKGKSGFITFILSFIPGLSHFYLGFRERGTIFLIVFFGSILSMVGLTVVFNNDGFAAILFFMLCIIWLVALIDAFSIRKKYFMEEQANISMDEKEENIGDMKESNKKAIALAFSIVPGAGHMYLGYQKKGLIMMTAFFFVLFFIGWTNLNMFLFVLPVLWFYSFFDALHSVDGKNVEDEEISFALPKIKPEWIGWCLIVMGVLVVIERVLYPILNISYQVKNYVQTGIVSLIFIVVGIKLLIGEKRMEDKSDEEIDDGNKGEDQK